MKSINFVMGYRISNFFKTSKYIKSDLGFSYSEENPKTGERVLSRSDKFALSYNHTYSSTLMKFGSITNIDFYIDSGINAPQIAIYYELEEFVINWDDNYYKSKGIDSYIGFLLKKVENDYNERINGPTIKTNNSFSEEDPRVESQDMNKPNDEPKYKGNSDTVKMNPGGARYEDIIAYIQNKTRNQL